MTDNRDALVGRDNRKWSFPKGCGPACREYDVMTGLCSDHFTVEDQIVQRVGDAFRRDLAAIWGSAK